MNHYNYGELIRGDRVRSHSPPEINQAIDSGIAANLRFYAGKSNYEISNRIEELDTEWDVERYLEANAATLSFLGALLGFKRSQKWFILPMVVAIFLLQHALQGWCPPLSVLRRLKIRTRKEIELEKYSLKALRGDFDNISSQNIRMNNAEEAVSASA